MATTVRLKLQLLSVSQAQKEETHNEALLTLDALVQAVALSIVTDTPALPSEGDVYIVPEGATGLWTGMDGQVAVFIGSAWQFAVPEFGWLFYAADEDVYYSYRPNSPTGWQATSI